VKARTTRDASLGLDLPGAYPLFGPRGPIVDRLEGGREAAVQERQTRERRTQEDRGAHEDASAHRVDEHPQMQLDDDCAAHLPASRPSVRAAEAPSWPETCLSTGPAPELSKATPGPRPRGPTHAPAMGAPCRRVVRRKPSTFA
jgi:hypothetical protein